MDACDEDGDGAVDCEEFVNWFKDSDLWARNLELQTCLNDERAGKRGGTQPVMATRKFAAASGLLAKTIHRANRTRESLRWVVRGAESGTLAEEAERTAPEMKVVAGDFANQHA